MIRLYVGLVLFLSGFTLFGQATEYCGTVGINEEYERYLTEHKDLIVRTQGCDLYVPITVHILGTDDGTGYFSLSKTFAALETLNEDFAESGITFFLAGPLNYINRSSWYEHEGFAAGSQMMNANNVPNTINCYIVENAAGNCGYRAFNGDAIAIAKSCNGADDHTWAHEMGHWLSLPHTFFGWEGKDYDSNEDTPFTVGNNRPVEKVDGSNCDAAADRICDTPADYLSFRWGCDDNNEYPDSLVDPNGIKFAVDGSLFMSYALDRCQNRFSLGQIDEMCTYLQNWVPEVISDEEPLGEVDISETNLVYPINGEIVEGSVKLQWEENGNATYYVVEVSAFSNVGILLLREIVYGTSLEVFGLASDKKYYWRIRAMNEYDFGYKENKSEIENFVTGELSSTDEYYAENLSLYPNPVEQENPITLRLNSIVNEEIKLSVFNLSGELASQSKHFLSSGSNEIKINTTSLPSGIYILRGKGDLHNFQKKFIVD